MKNLSEKNKSRIRKVAGDMFDEAHGCHFVVFEHEDKPNMFLVLRDDMMEHGVLDVAVHECLTQFMRDDIANHEKILSSDGELLRGEIELVMDDILGDLKDFVGDELKGRLYDAVHEDLINGRTQMSNETSVIMDAVVMIAKKEKEKKNGK